MSTARTRVRGTVPGRGNRPTEPDSDHIEPAPTWRVTYDCPNGEGHALTVTMFADPTTSIPTEWQCPKHGTTAHITTAPDGATTVTPTQDVRAQRLAIHEPARPGCWYTTHHREQVTKRRTTEELQALLDERLAALRAGRLHAAA